jgi:hypothetical protein
MVFLEKVIGFENPNPFPGFFLEKVIGFENPNPFPRQLVCNPLDIFSCSHTTAAWI